ncbi:MAG: hypothetical protein ABW133_01600 [Polyangiaceae bacterium]
MLNRKEFLAGIAGFTATLFVYACGGDDDNGGKTGGGDGNCNDDVDIAITSNHGHAFSINAADFDGGQSKTYSIKGTSEHDHSVTLTAQDFTDLKNGKTVTKESTNNAGHSHPMQIVC